MQNLKEQFYLNILNLMQESPIKKSVNPLEKRQKLDKYSNSTLSENLEYISLTDKETIITSVV